MIQFIWILEQQELFKDVQLARKITISVSFYRTVHYLCIRLVLNRNEINNYFHLPNRWTNRNNNHPTLRCMFLIFMISDHGNNLKIIFWQEGRHFVLPIYWCFWCLGSGNKWWIEWNMDTDFDKRWNEW